MNNYTYHEIERLNKEIQLIDLTIKKLNHFCSEYSLWSISDDVKNIINIKSQFRDLMTLMMTFEEDLYFFKDSLALEKALIPLCTHPHRSTNKASYLSEMSAKDFITSVTEISPRIF